MLSQLISPVTFSTRKNWAMAIAKVWMATNPNSLPLYDPALGEILMNEPCRVRRQAVHTIIHPDLLTLFAFSLSYDPSVTARNVPFTSASLIHSTLISPSTICSHIHLPPIEQRWVQNKQHSEQAAARGGPISWRRIWSPGSASTFAGRQCGGT
jgi:hypothetical protein